MYDWITCTCTLLFCNKGTVIISQLWRIRLTFIIIIINISGILWEILQKSMVWFLRKNTKYLFPPMYSLWIFDFSASVILKTSTVTSHFYCIFFSCKLTKVSSSKKLDTSMDCNLEALATLMLFHIKVSLFYPFDS